MKNKKKITIAPFVFNVFKPQDFTSYDIVRHFKYHLPQGFGKIGHLGTLDPFAHGVLPIAVGGAARLNDLFHEYLPKTYIADGILGEETETGDGTVDPSQIDHSSYLKETISQFEISFIQQELERKFLGEYWQAPHKISAAKFEGKPLHQWAREGVDVKKPEVKRYIYHLKVLDYQFPKLQIEFQVSSGTYIRTLFSDCARYLGTLGRLNRLERSAIGDLRIEDSLRGQDWPNREFSQKDYYGKAISPEKLLPFKSFECHEDLKKKLFHGSEVAIDSNDHFVWAKNQNNLLCLLEKGEQGLFRPKVNFQQMYEDE